MNPKTQSKILDVRTETEYQDTIYEQTVEIEIEGTKLTLFDGSNTIAEESVGRTCDLTILAYPRSNGVNKIAESEKKIVKPEKQISKWSYDFYGQIAATDVEDVWSREPYNNLVVLDVGVGCILLPLDGVQGIDKGGIDKGDFLLVRSSSTNLVAMSC